MQENIELTYHICSLLLGLLVFFMKFTADNTIIDILFKILGKLIPLFVILYSGVYIFKYFGIL